MSGPSRNREARTGRNPRSQASGRIFRSRDERLRSAAAAARVGIFACDFATGEKDWSPEFLALYGLEADAPLPMEGALPAAVHVEDRERLLAELRACTPHAPRFDVEHRIVRSDGQERWLLTRGIIEFQQDDQPCGISGFVVDITDSKGAEATLRETGRRLRVASRAAGLGIFEWDRSTDTVEWDNDRMFEIFGVGREAAPIGRARFLNEVVRPQDRPVVERALAQAEQSEQPVEVECRIRRVDDGRERWLHMWGHLVDTAPGHRRRLVGVVADVTERREAEAELRESAELLDLGDAFFELDREWRIIRVNRRQEELSQKPRRETIGRVFWEVWPETAAPDSEYWRQYHRCMRERIPVRFDEYFAPLDLWTGVSAYPTTRGGIAVFFRDVSARKRAEAGLREGEERFRTLADNISQLAWMADDQGWIFWYNRRWYEYTGTTLEEMEGWGWRKVHHPDHVERVVQRISASWESGEPWEDLFPLRGRDGQYRWFLSRALPIRADDGRILRWFGTNTDITEHKRIEEELAAARTAAEAANVAKSRFLANMSHELRTPMTAILGMTDLALREELSPLVRDHLETVKDSGDMLLELLDELLDLARIEAGQMELDRRPFSLRRCLDQVGKAFAARAAEQNIDLLFDVADDVHDVLVGDPLRLRQVLVNLVGNAVKFTDSGEVVVSATIDQRHDEHVVLGFAVRDTGIGIAAEDLERIFSPFAQTDSSLTRRHGGSGLGLAIVRNLVTLMGGDTRVTSTLGGGSTFSFTAEFGIGEERDIEGPPGPGPLDQLDDLPVLLVLQRPTTRRLFERTLSGWGMRPTCAEDVSAALVRVHQAAAENRPFRLLIADASLGPPDGFALAEWLENSQVLAGPVILLISAAERSSQRERCAAVGARCLEKPVAPSDLQEAILAALDDESVRPEESSAARIEPAARSFHVLLVEDTPANQKLVTYLLKARGHVVELAADGLEALDRVRRRGYDVVLMDLQMPRMDGVAATAAIRALAAPRAAKVPIIAMTAHALRGDAEYCLAAGMNDYISKPIEGEELIALVEKWGDTHWHAATKPAPLRPPKPLEGDDPVVVGDASPGAPIFDRDEALRTCYGKLHLLRKVVTAYFEEAGPLMARIREGAARHDTADLGHAAHQLKNLLLYLGAPRVTNLVQRLERAARAADLAGIGGDIDQLAAALAELEDELSELRE